MSKSSKTSKNSFSKKDFEAELQELENLMKGGYEDGDNMSDTSDDGSAKPNPDYMGTDMQGGADDKRRHFRVVRLNGKDVNIGDVTVKMHQNPVAAARKLLRSICKFQGLKKLNKLKCSAVFYIYESGRGSRNKIYGPYKGSYVKLDGKDKKVSKDGKVITYTMKANVKKMKGNKLEMSVHTEKTPSKSVKGGMYKPGHEGGMHKPGHEGGMSKPRSRK
jgi:hypothetical protein